MAIVSGDTILQAIGRLLRLVPVGTRGKHRVARLLVAPFISRNLVEIPDRYGNSLQCPGLSDPIAFSLMVDGVYEPETIEQIVARTAEGKTYVDVGANIGAIALAVAAQRPDLQVLCVEADPRIAAILRRNVKANGLTNVTVAECVAGPRTGGKRAFYPAPPEKFGMGSVAQHFGGEPILVDERALDDLLDGLALPEAGLIKIDIEGSELGALQGLVRRLTSPSPPAVIFEFVDWAEGSLPDQRPGDAQALLRSFGYRLFRLDVDKTEELASPLTRGAGMLLALAMPRIHADDQG